MGTVVLCVTYCFVPGISVKFCTSLRIPVTVSVTVAFVTGVARADCCSECVGAVLRCIIGRGGSDGGCPKIVVLRVSKLSVGVLGGTVSGNVVPALGG